MNEEDITLKQEIRIIHHKLDFLLEVMPHLHSITQHVAVGKPKGYSFENSKQAVKDKNELMNNSIKAVLDEVSIEGVDVFENNTIKSKVL